jgi:hypothetical protein
LSCVCVWIRYENCWLVKRLNIIRIMVDNSAHFQLYISILRSHSYAKKKKTRLSSHTGKPGHHVIPKRGSVCSKNVFVLKGYTFHSLLFKTWIAFGKWTMFHREKIYIGCP